jgi:hypothetical protein
MKKPKMNTNWAWEILKALKVVEADPDFKKEVEDLQAMREVKFPKVADK